MATAAESARQALEQCAELKRQLDLLKQLVESGDLSGARDRLAALESRVGALEKFEAELRRIGVLEDRINELKKAKDESDKRQWQFVYIAAGAGFALLS